MTLPAGWSSCTLDAVQAPEPGSFVDGPFGSNLKTEHYTASGPRVIRLENVGDGVFRDAETHISPEHFDRLRRHEARAGDVVIALLGDEVPRACLVPGRVGAAIVKADCPRLRPDPRLALSEFVVYALNSEQLRGQGKALVHGVGRPRLKLSELRGLNIPLAPLPEQRRIVEALETHFTRLDAAIDTLKRVRANLKRYRAAVLRAALNERLLPPTSSTPWPSRPFDAAFEILDFRRRPVNATARTARFGRVPYYGATGQVGWIDEPLFDEELVLLGEDGAPFLEPTKAKAYLIQGPAWVNNHAHVLRARPGMHASFLMHQLNAIDYHSFVSGTTRLKLSQAPMRRIALRVPELAEQEAVAAEIERRFSICDAVASSIDADLLRCARLRQSLLRVAFDGRLVPQDPRDEPASVLLDRIRAERAAASFSPREQSPRSRR